MFLAFLHIIVVFVLIVLILIQSPSSDSLSSFSSANQNINSFVVKRSTSGTISKVTAFVAAFFMINTLLLVGINAKDFNKKSLLSDEKVVEDNDRINHHNNNSGSNIPLND